MYSTLPKITNRFLFLPLFIAMLFIARQAVAQPGALDPSFGVGGRVMIKIDTYVGNQLASIIQPDGKIVIAGFASDGAKYNVVLYRLKINGRFDSSFGINGKSVTDFQTFPYSLGIAVDLQLDGKIVFAANDGNNITLGRYNTNGTPDSSFGVNGKSINDIGNAEEATSYALKVLPGGKFAVAGIAYAVPGVGGEVSFLSVFKENGSLDSSFGVNGAVFTEFTANAGHNSSAYSLATIGDHIFVGGEADLPTLPHTEGLFFAISKYNSDGSFDTTFANNGRLATDQMGSGILSSLFLQKDGKILMSGSSPDANVDYQLIRYNADGTKDSSFGKNGIATTDVGGFDVSRNNSLTEDVNEKIIITGTSFRDSSSPFVTVRYNSDAKLDKTFGNNGKVSIMFTNGNEAVTCLALQKDGKIVIAGYSVDSATTNIVLARYLIHPALPIQLSSFTAAKQNSHVLLNWQTATEINNAYFIVQCSNDGKDFADVGRVDGHGNSSITEQYNFTDNKPGSGVNYYRLQQFDADNSFTYSNTISVDFSTADKYTIYPNPVKDVFTIDNLSGSATLTLLDARGRIVLKTVTANKTYNGNIKPLAAGVYYLQVTEGNKTTTVKIVKQ